MRISIILAIFHVQAPILKTYSGLSYLDKNTLPDANCLEKLQFLSASC